MRLLIATIAAAASLVFPAIGAGIPSEILSNPDQYKILGATQVRGWPALFVEYDDGSQKTMFLCVVTTDGVNKMTCDEVN